MNTCSRLRPRVARVTYRPVLTVERELVRRRLARTEGAAHQLLLRLRSLLPEVDDAFIAAGALERLAWFDYPRDVIRNRRPIPPLAEALARKARIDGIEDAALTALAGDLGNPAQGRATLRLALQERAATDDLVAAICAQHGWTA